MYKFKQMAGGAAAVVSLAFGIAPATAAPMIGFGIPSATGDVDVVVSNLGTEIVSAYDLDVFYDTGALAFTGLTLSGALGSPGAPFEGYVSLSGLVDFFGNSLMSDNDLWSAQLGGPVTLATLNFTGTDFSSLAFINWGTDSVNNVTNDVKGRNALQIIPGGQIPEPATYGLVGMALLAAGVARRRQA